MPGGFPATGGIVILLRMRIRSTVAGLLAACSLAAPLAAQERVRVELPYGNGTVVIDADQIEKETADTWVATGQVVVTYGESILKSERLIYRQDLERIISETPLELTKGIQWLKGSSGEFNLGDGTGEIRDADGFTDEQLYVKARVLYKTGPDTYRAEDGLLTACEEAVPKWSFRIDRANLKVDGRATLRHTVFKVKKFPILYFPFLTFPTAKRERSTGFLLPSIGNSNNKGMRFTQEFYLVLGKSADVLLREDYFSRRGFGHGVIFRMRPRHDTYLRLDGYTIDDRLNQGGASLTGTGETHFGPGFRLVADFSLVSNFVFRRVFSDNFFLATRPSEASHVFLSNNFGSKSFNFQVERQETFFSGRNTVIRHSPGLSFGVSGQRIPHTPLYFDLDAAAEGLSRVDNRIETPALTQRLDLHPQIYFSVPLFQGLRMTPRLAGRETFYSDSVRSDDQGNREVVAENLTRQYFDFTLDLRGWGLSKVYRRPESADWKHLIEPEFRYRYTQGIDEFREIIRFDENDTIADTNEVEYAIVNRFFVKRTPDGDASSQEWLSVRVGQKYFVDPDFGGAFRSGSVNQFLPLYDLTGFPYGGLQRSFSPLTTSVRFNPDRRVSFDVRGDFDFAFDRFRNFSVTGFYLRRRFNFSASYFLTKQLEAGTFENNQIQGRIGYGNPRQGFSVTSSLVYDARTRELLHIRARSTYAWECCSVAIELERLELGLREEQQIRFSFYLKGIGAFGTIRRPDRVF